MRVGIYVALVAGGRRRDDGTRTLHVESGAFHPGERVLRAGTGVAAVDVLAVLSEVLHLVLQELFGGRVDGDSDPREAVVSPAGCEGDPEYLIDSRGSGAGVAAGEPLAGRALLSA